MTGEQTAFQGLPCHCKRTTHGDPALVVITGGPGAGKTAVLEVARRYLCEHIAVLPGTLDGLAYWPESEESFWNDYRVN